MNIALVHSGVHPDNVRYDRMSLLVKNIPDLRGVYYTNPPFGKAHTPRHLDCECKPVPRGVVRRLKLWERITHIVVLDNGVDITARYIKQRAERYGIPIKVVRYPKPSKRRRK